MDDAMMSALKSGVWYLIAPAAVVIAIRFYRKPWIQALIPGPVKWDALPLWLRQVIVFATSFVAAAIASVQAGMGAWAAIISSLPIAAAAVGAHKATKFIGHELTDTVLAKDPFYEPGITRKALDLVVPLDHHRLDGRIGLKPKT